MTNSCLISSFDLIKGEWIRLEEPVYKTYPKEKKASRKKKSATPYDELLQAAEKLMEKARAMQGCSNSDIRELKEAISRLL